MIKVITVLFALAAISVARAQPVMPFAEKLARQQELGGRRAHAWRSGELVRAPMLSYCESALTLTVASIAAGGLKRESHRDHFLVATSDPHWEKIKDWQGLIYEGVVKILAPVQEPNPVENSQSYLVRVIDLSPPDLVFNPLPDYVDQMTQNQPVMIEGEVVALDETHIQIKSRRYYYNYVYTVSLRQGVPVLEGFVDRPLAKMEGSAFVQKGDFVRLRAHATERRPHGVDPTHRSHRLWADARFSTYLEHPGPRRLEAMLEARHIVRKLSRMMIEAIKNARWHATRMIDTVLQSRHLSPAEINRLAKLRAQIPQRERALDLSADLRASLEVLDRAFRIDLSEESVAGVRAFAMRWANLEEWPSGARAEDASLELSVMSLLRSLPLPQRDLDLVAELAVRRRLRGLETRSAVIAIDADWREVLELVDIFSFLEDTRSIEGFRILIRTACRLAYLQSVHWRLRGYLVHEVFGCLRSAVDATTGDTRDELIKLLQDYRVKLLKARDDLKDAQDLDDRSSPALTDLRHVLDVVH